MAWPPPDWLTQPIQTDPLAPPVPAETVQGLTPVTDDFDLEAALFPPPPEPEPSVSPVTEGLDLATTLFPPQPEIQPEAEVATIPPPFAPEVAGAPSLDLGASLLPPEQPQVPTGQLLGLEEPAPEPVPTTPQPTGPVNPVELAAQGAQRESERERFNAANTIEMLDMDRKQAAENQAAHQAALQRAQKDNEEINAQAQAIASKPVDSSLPVGKSIIGMITAALAGFMNPGGKNAGVEAMSAAIDRQVAIQTRQKHDQLAALGQRRAGIQFDLDAQNEIFKSAEALRIGTLRQADQELAAKAALYDPQGTTYQRVQEARQAVQEKIQAAEAQATQQSFDNHIKSAQLGLQRRRLRDQEQQQAFARQQAARAQEAAQAAAQGEANEKEQKLQRELGIPNIRGTGDLTMKDGTPFRARTQEEAKQTRKKIASSRQVNQLANAWIAIRAAHGYEQGIIPGEDRQKMDSIAAQLKLAIKDAANLGVMSDTDAQLIDDLIGKPGDVIDNITRLETVKKNNEAGLNNQLRSQGFDRRISLPTPQDVRKENADEALDSFSTVKTDAGVRPTQVLVGAVDSYVHAKRADMHDLLSAPLDSKIKGFDDAVEDLEKREKDAYAKLKKFEKAGDADAADAQREVYQALNFQLVKFKGDRESLIKMRPVTNGGPLPEGVPTRTHPDATQSPFDMRPNRVVP